MADLKQIVSRKAENDTKWREQQQAERENTVAMQDAGITEITTTPEAYARYLEMQGDNRRTAPGTSPWSCSASRRPPSSPPVTAGKR